MYAVKKANNGSVLLLVLSMIILMVAIATSFMSTMSRQRGTAFLLAARTRCEVGMEQATARITKSLLEEYVDSGTTYSSNDSNWFKLQHPVNNPDGDIWTEDGVRLGSDFNEAGNMINVGVIDLTDMMQHGSVGNLSEYYGFWQQYSGTRARWYNMTFYDDNLQPVKIDDSLTENEKAKIRRTSRYVLRYAVNIMDCDAQLAANNNYPGAPIYYNPANPEEYNRYQSYLRHFGRSIKSLTSPMFHYHLSGMQYRSDDGNFSDTRDPFDYEDLRVFPDGVRISTSRWVGKSLKYDLRLRREAAFRMSPLAWVEQANGLDQKSLHAIGGNRLTTWYQIGRHHGCKGPIYQPVFQFSPYAGSMLGEPLKTVNPDPCTVPWKVNLLTCSDQTLASIYGSLSSHIKHGDGSPYNIDPATENNWWQKAGYANADLFGPGYPEAFPLGFEDGKDVPLVGMVSKETVPEYAWSACDKNTQEFYGGGLATGRILLIGGNRYPATGYSYWSDLHYALELVQWRMRSAWSDKKSLSTRNIYPKQVGGYYYLQKNPYTNADILGVNGDSYIDQDETDPDIMINQIIMETCRMLGEGYIKPHSGSTPATSWNKYNQALPSLLGGGESFVGPNLKGNVELGMKRCKLSIQTNTRAMEYVLNDVLISLYGKANPYFVQGVDSLNNIAVDFNGDGHAESTISGWLNPSSGSLTWSWWWNGLGIEGKPVNGDWMKEGCWIRFHEDSTIQRRRGGEWIDLDPIEVSEFLSINDTFLYNRWSATSGPIRPFSYTGRLFIGKSKMFQCFVRTELVNIPKQSTMTATNRSFVYTIDPDNDGSFEDSHIATGQEFHMKSTDL